ncbi:hypothetical protein [Micromonospora globosa]|uniref:hypothetical protein n=1 Tax=Micromonospora globosa TaxID=47863 RepID=UPI0004BFCDAF|nr:hypothetical protein [Micromonospora globosa]
MALVLAGIVAASDTGYVRLGPVRLAEALSGLSAAPLDTYACRRAVYAARPVLLAEYGIRATVEPTRETRPGRVRLQLLRPSRRYPNP